MNMHNSNIHGRKSLVATIITSGTAIAGLSFQSLRRCGRARCIIVPVCLLTAIFLSDWCLGADGEWPQFLGPKRDNRSTDTGLLKQWPKDGPPVLWKNTTIGVGYSSVAVTKDSIYTTGNVDKQAMLFCLDLQGKEKWRAVQGPVCERWDKSGTRSTPTVDGDKIYVLGADGLLTCHGTADGKLVWSRDIVKELAGEPDYWLYSESVLVIDDKVILSPGGQNAIVALNKDTGKDIWKSDAAFKAGYSSPVAVTVNGSTVVINGSPNGHKDSPAGLFMVDVKTGRKVGSGPQLDISSPIYTDNHLFWSLGKTKGSVCYKVDCVAGNWTFAEAWTCKDLRCEAGGYIVEKGFIYGSHDDGLACIELATGKTMWKSKDIKKGSITFADGMLYLMGGDKGEVKLAECTPEGLKLAGIFSVAGKGLSWAYPVVTGGKLYLRYDTNLYCFDVKAK